jgi:hypothetical protein
MRTTWWLRQQPREDWLAQGTFRTPLDAPRFSPLHTDVEHASLAKTALE